jgi:hypothetical protein
VSNHLAVATVSATLAHILRGPIQDAVDGADVFTDRPSGDNGAPVGPEVRIFLYRVQPNAAWRNQDLPTRRSSGELLDRPQAALDLEYALTFYGDERTLEPQRLLGAVVRELHARPILDREDILAVAEAVDSPLATTDLADQPERVRFMPLSLDLEELSKLWSVFFQTTYRLSVAYQASVVLISPDEPARAPLPVREPRLVATTIRRPRVEHVASVVALLEPVTVGDVVRIQGSQLRGDVTSVWFGPERVDPPQEAVGEREIRLAVPATVHAGLVGVRVEHRRLLGDPPTERAAGSSNIAPLVVRPRIRQIAGVYQVSAGVNADGVLELSATLDPAVGKRQRVVVHLNQLAPPVGQLPASHSFPDESRDVEGAPEETDTIEVPIPGVPSGSYLVRVQVDGAESPLDRDLDDTSPTFEQYVGPTVAVP